MKAKLKVKEISVGITYTENIVHNRNLKIHAGMVVEVEPSENIEDAYQKAFENLKKQIKKGLAVSKGGFN